MTRARASSGAAAPARAVLAATLLAASGASLAGCRFGGASYSPNPGRYDVLPEADVPVVRSARARLEAGEPRAALALLDPLVARHPLHLSLAILRQEARLALASDGTVPGGPGGSGDPGGSGGAPGGSGGPGAALFPAALARAEEADAVVPWILAARLAATPADARLLLERAERLDPRCVWVPYARAFGFVQERDFARARDAIDQALRLDGGHLPARRLQALLLANAGEVEEATEVLVDWLPAAEQDPFVGPRALAEARADLAALLVLDGRADQALATLDSLDPGELASPARAELVRAVALDEAGREPRALAAAQLAAQLDPTGFLPLLHQALLAKNRGDAAAEEEAWRRLLARIEERGARAGGSPAPIDFDALLVRLRAHARLERLERAARRADAAQAQEGETGGGGLPR